MRFERRTKACVVRRRHASVVDEEVRLRVVGETDCELGFAIHNDKHILITVDPSG